MQVYGRVSLQLSQEVYYKNVDVYKKENLTLGYFFEPEKQMKNRSTGTQGQWCHFGGHKKLN